MEKDCGSKVLGLNLTIIEHHSLFKEILIETKVRLWNNNSKVWMILIIDLYKKDQAKLKVTMIIIIIILKIHNS